MITFRLVIWLLGRFSGLLVWVCLMLHVACMCLFLSCDACLWGCGIVVYVLVLVLLIVLSIVVSFDIVLVDVGYSFD